MADALHPQTFLAYGMNGNDSMKGFGQGLGSAAPEGGYSWYAGI
jgi:hypothetical protein